MAKHVAYPGQFFDTYPTLAAAKEFFRYHPNGGELRSNSDVSEKDLKTERDKDLQLISIDSGYHCLFLSMKDGELYAYDPGYTPITGSKLRNTGRYEDRVKRFLKTGSELGLNEGFFQDNPTFAGAQAKLRSLPQTMPSDASPADIDFMRQYDMRVMEADDYGGYYVSMRTGDVYHYNPERANDPLTSSRFRRDLYYDKFVAANCNKPSNGTTCIQDQLIEMGLL